MSEMFVNNRIKMPTKLSLRGNQGCQEGLSCIITGVMWEESVFHPCFPVFVSSVFPEPRDILGAAVENTSGYCFITLLIGPGLIPQAPEQPGQITKGRSLNLSGLLLVGVRNLKRYSSLHTTLPSWLVVFKMMPFQTVRWKCFSWHSFLA